MSPLARDAGVRVGRLALLARSLITAARAGVRRCLVVGEAPALKPDPRYPAEIVHLPADLDAVARALCVSGLRPDDRIFWIDASVVHQPAVLRALASPHDAPRPVIATRQGRAGAPEIVPLAALPTESLALLWPAWVGSAANKRPNGADVATLASVVAAEQVTRCPIDGFAAVVVRDGGRVDDAAHQLLRGLENPRDGWIDTLINRRLSRPISHFLLRSPLSPNQITLLSFAAGVLGAFAFARGAYGFSVAGALLLQLAAVLDCCDGEVARLQFEESRFGDALDVALDALANAAIFVGIARGVVVSGRLAHAGGLGLAAAVGIIGSFVAAIYAERRLPEDSSIPAHRLAQRLVGTMTTRDFSVLVLLASVCDALPTFIWASAIGANVFWLLLVALFVRGAMPRQVREEAKAKEAEKELAGTLQ